MECRWNAGGRVRMRLRRLPSEDERFRRAAAAVAAVRHIGMSACRHVGGATGGALRCPVLRGAARDRGSGDAARPASAARIESRATGGSCAIAPNRGDIRDADREGAWRKKRGGARLSSWKAGRREGGKAGRREGGKAGRREGGKAGRREGVVVQCPWTVRKEGNVSSGGPNHGQACVFRGIQGRSDTTRRRAGLPLFQGVWGGWNWGDSPASLGRAVAGGA